MLFIFLGLVYIFILIMAQSIEEDRLEKENKEWKNIIGEDYYE